VIASRNAQRLEQACAHLVQSGVDAEWHCLNIRDEAQVGTLFDALDQHGRLPDILVNNAGGQFEAPALEISPNGFRAVVDLNLTGTWLMSQAFGARREKIRAGRIINIVLSIENGLPNYAHAAAARAGVINLTKTLAVEWARFGITVNAVAPGIIRTAGLDQYAPSALAAAVDALPIRRMGEPLEVARAVAYLASPAADYVTGTVLFVDGGKHLTGGRPQKD
jgi:NAD(P)-dependent dehydrogenase (short-subunit alcohol dehydrogenase family)